MLATHITRNQYAMSHHRFYDTGGLHLDKGHVALNHYTEIEFKITIARALGFLLYNAVVRFTSNARIVQIAIRLLHINMY